MRPTVRTIAALALACGCGGGDPTGGADGGGAAPDLALPPLPPTVCDLPAKAVDTSQPTSVVGGGAPASCTDAALRAAVGKGGIVTFDCGADPVTITVASEVAVDKDTVIDGGGRVTLSGGKQSRILHIKSAWNVPTPLLTVQHLAFVDGFTSDVANTKSTAAGGAAIF